jgi:hypothetical protein
MNLFETIWHEHFKKNLAWQLKLGKHPRAWFENIRD